MPSTMLRLAPASSIVQPPSGRFARWLRHRGIKLEGMTQAERREVCRQYQTALRRGVFMTPRERDLAPITVAFRAAA